MCTALSITPSAARETTLPEYYELCEYWIEHPPIHLMVAGFLGVKSGQRPAEKEKPTDLGILLGMAPGGTFRVGTPS